MGKLFFAGIGRGTGTKKRYLLLLLLAGVLLPRYAAQAQNQGVFYGGRAPQANLSGAEQEAEQKVSLSAEKIIEILHDEPGLLLQVKKMLVRKAYEQGRILEPTDLTDDALFTLLREDETIRALATREIEDRAYVRAKPTRAELEQEQREAGQNPANAALAGLYSQPGANGSKGQSQEDVFWSQHDRAPSNVPSNPSLVPNVTLPPANPPSPNPARQLDRASFQSNQDVMDGSGLDPGLMSRISPDQLSSLLSTSSPASLALASSMLGPNGTAAGMGRSPLANPAMPPDLEAAGPPPPALRASPANTQQARLETPRRTIPSPTDLDEDRPLIRQHPNPYANVPALYDLYAQVVRRPPVLEHFGLAVFRNGTGNLDNLPMDLPAGPEYVLGPGDGLSIELWGGVAQRLQRVVDREGRLALPEVGTVPVAGRTLGDVQQLVQSVLRTQFRDVEADVSLARIRSVRVYVVGDVQAPGAYDISSLSTPLNALYAAGGPTSRGSLRHLRQYRGRQLVQELDGYDLLLHGVHAPLASLQSGDTILVPPMGPEVTVEGMVRRPALYELAGEKSLAETLQLAGGVLPSGTLRHIAVERVVAHEKRTLLELDLPESNDEQAVNRALDQFQVQDGDQIRISPILPYAEQTVYLDGHVFRPGKYPYREGMKITDLISSYKDLLPEPSGRHAEVIRLQSPDYTPQVLAFDLNAAMDGKEQDIALKPFDTVRIFSRYDFEDPPSITVSGEVRDPGDHVTNGVTHLRDAVYLAGGVGPDAELGDAQIFRKTEDGKLKVLSVNLSRALAGDAIHNVLLAPTDRIFIHRSLAKSNPPTVQVEGEVARPGKYPLGEGMTAAQLVRLAGGLKRSADTGQADLARYLGEDGRRIGEHQGVEIAKALAGEEDADVTLREGDVLSIRQLAGWNDIGAAVTVKGEVVHPGTFGIREGECLSSVLARAGGLRSDAYPYGAVLERVQVRELEARNRAELIRRVQEEGGGLKLIPEIDADSKLAKDAALLQWRSALEKLQNTPPTGRLVIRISSDVKRWANTAADIELRAGDELVIPKAPNFAMVSGAVYNPTAVSFKSGKNAAWYLHQAGGTTNMADKKAIFLIRADGSVAGGTGGMFSGGVLGAEVRPGDLLVVPEKAFTGTTRWRESLQAAQLVSAVGIAVQVARGF